MTPNDIVVGKKYTNGKHTLLGCGKRVMWEGTFNSNDSNFTEKHLVIIDSTMDNALGMFIQDPDDCSALVWEAIRPVE